MRGEIPYRYGIDTVSIPGFVLWIQYRYTETETKTQTETVTYARSLANVSAADVMQLAYEREGFLKPRNAWTKAAFGFQRLTVRLGSENV